MNPEELLAQLRNLDTPTDISWWPPALGWWILASLIFSGILIASIAILHRYRAGAAARTAKVELIKAHEHYLNKGADNAATTALLRDTNAILKRLAVNFEGSEQVAGLTGRSWRNYLSEVAPQLNATELEPFESALYQPKPNISVDEFMTSLNLLIDQMKGIKNA